MAIAGATAQSVGCPRSRKRGAAQSMSEERPLATKSSAMAMEPRYSTTGHSGHGAERAAEAAARRSAGRPR
eukprot:1865673-Alexandrium_andersonii.AAC.1